MAIIIAFLIIELGKQQTKDRVYARQQLEMEMSVHGPVGEESETQLLEKKT